MDARIIKYFEGELTFTERVGLLKDAENDSALRSDLLNAQNVHGIFLLSDANAGDRQEAERQYRRFMFGRNRKKILQMTWQYVGYAAAIALLVVLTLKLHNSTAPAQSETVAVNQELYVPAGQRARITLPDGSTAWLNAGSTLRYPSIFGSERNVSLTGEAWFEVAHNPERPFIVNASDILDITALGTKFNVSSYPKADEMSTALTEGSVKVSKHGSPNSAVVLQPGEQAILGNGTFRVEAIDNDMLLWKDGIYTFKGEMLGKIIEKLELYYDVEIVVNDPRILKRPYTGKFRQRDGAMEILRIISKIHHFRIRQNEEMNKITLY